MEAKILKYATKGVEDFIYGIHLNNLEATSEILRNIANTIEKSNCKEIKFKRFSNNITNITVDGVCEINPLILDYSISTIIEIIESAVAETQFIL
jgi:hypothetical protein